MGIFADMTSDVYDALADETGSAAATISPDRTASGTARVVIRAENPADAPQLEFGGVNTPSTLASINREDLSADCKTGDLITIPAGNEAVGTYRIDARLVARDTPRSVVYRVVKQ